MTSMIPSQCLACVHLDRSNVTPDGLLVPFQCAAYPERIPDDFLLFGADHREPHGDEVNGIVFAQEDSDAAPDAFDAWQQTFGEATD